MTVGSVGRWVRVEDVAIAAANVLAVPVVAALGGGPSSSNGLAPLLGLVELTAVIGAIAALATRPADEPPFRSSSFRAWLFAGPLIGAVSLVGSDAFEHLGSGGSDVFGLATFAVIVAAFVAGDRLPVLATPWRRALVAPFVLVASNWFARLVGDILADLDLEELGRALFDPSAPPEAASLAGLFAFFLVAGSAAFYAMFIMAPRELAFREPDPRVWLLRYVVFLASAAIGAGGVVLL